MGSMKLVHFPVVKKTRNFILRSKLNWAIFQISRKIAAHARPRENQNPVVFFNASTRLTGLSQNAAFSMISSWALQLAGVPVFHFACRAGMSHCVLGTTRGNLTDPPPCKKCQADTRRFSKAAPTYWFDSQQDPDLLEQLEGLRVSDLKRFTHQEKPLGALVLPSLRWVLRRHNLMDDPLTIYLFREFIISANSVMVGFQNFLEETCPAAVVLYNGLLYPEAAVRFIAQQQGIRVITHEVGFLPYSAFFTSGLAPAYPIEIPPGFELSQAKNQIFDSYLEKRFHGDFTMAGIRFWQEMKELDQALVEQIQDYDQIVAVFTNVIFDTSQTAANTVFSDMFDWLDQVLRTTQRFPNTLFIVRAHPDEMRQGKESRESVEEWVKNYQIDQMENVLFIGPDEPLSSYELIRKSKFVMVYNSSIGLEASLLGVPVLCGGRARYTQYPMVFFPDSRHKFLEKAEDMIKADLIEVPPQFLRNARRFLYYQLFKVSIPFGKFINGYQNSGYVNLKRFPWRELYPEGSATIQTIMNGILHEKEFVMKDRFEI